MSQPSDRKAPDGWVAIAVRDQQETPARSMDNLARQKRTDRHDARELARRLWVGEVERYARSYYPTEEEYGVRKVLRVRQQLVGMRPQVSTQIRALRNAYLLPSPGPALSAASSLTTLARSELPTTDLTLCLPTLVSVSPSMRRVLLAATRKNMRHLASQSQLACLRLRHR